MIDQAQRAKLYVQAQQIFHEDVLAVLFAGASVAQ